jgi:hypothetical protein
LRKTYNNLKLALSIELELKSTNKFLSIVLLILLAILIDQCKRIDGFYRPDLPEEICTVGIIDIDDTTYYDTFSPSRPPFIPHDSLVFARNIYFERSIQSDYSDGLTDSLREFSFRISDDKEDMFVYNSQQATRNPEVKIPANLKFESGKKYFFHASEKETASVSAETTVPELPPEPSLISLKTGINILDLPKEGCYYLDILGGYFDGSTFTRRNAEIEFFFPNNNPTSYYAILLTGSYSDSRVDWSPGWGSNLLEFNVLESNTNGFNYPIQGLKTVQKICSQTPFYDSHGILRYSYGENCKLYPMTSAYFIDGNKIPGGNCTLKISAQWDYIHFIPGFIKCFRVRLMSIPKEAYLFYKSLYTYKVQLNDPFSELVNINGNIIGGNGVIAICRSRELIVYTGQNGGELDTVF